MRHEFHDPLTGMRFYALRTERDYGAFTLSGENRLDCHPSVVEELLRLAEENERLREAGDAVLRGFEAGVFVREVSGDAATDWLIKAVPHIAALARLAHLLRSDHATLQDGEASSLSPEASADSMEKPSTNGSEGESG